MSADDFDADVLERRRGWRSGVALDEIHRQNEQEIRDFIVDDLLDGEVPEIDIDTPLIEWGVVDSLYFQVLLTFLEDRYKIMIPPEMIKPEIFGTIRVMARSVEVCRREQVGHNKVGPYEFLNRLMESYGLERQWVELSRGRHHLLRCTGSKPALVLLPGLGAPASSWGLILRSLNGKREATALDLAGFGVSDDSSDGVHIFDRQVHNTIAIVEKAVGGPCIFVGNSAGGMIAAEIARRRPDLCRALVFISYGRIRNGDVWWRELDALARDVESFWRRAFYNPPPLTRELRDQLKSTFASTAYQEFLDKKALAHLDVILEGLKLPVMFIGGMDDGIIGRDIIEAGAAQVPGARIEWIPRCGHFAQSERSEEVLVYIEDFLRQLEAGNA